MTPTDNLDIGACIRQCASTSSATRPYSLAYLSLTGAGGNPLPLTEAPVAETFRTAPPVSKDAMTPIRTDISHRPASDLRQCNAARSIVVRFDPFTMGKEQNMVGSSSWSGENELSHRFR